ncbi:MAG: phosphotransferase family protein [Alphaproteobacteria bacterium]
MRRFDRPRLARFLSEASGAREVRLSAPELLAGGAIQENWGFAAHLAGGAFAGRHRLVLRTEAATGVGSSLGRVEEFAVQRAALAAGVTVAEPLWACADPQVIGTPFFVMRRVPGTAQGREITANPALEPHLPAVAARLGEELARIQAIRPPRPGLGFLPHIDAARHIAFFRAYLDGHPNPRPVLEWAIRWLERHLPEPLPPVLCHRDFRTGNYMLAPSPTFPRLPGSEGRGATGAELTAILDWEFAGWGDPDEDIGWFCCKGWRFARLDREAGGIAARDMFYRAYEAASGRRLDPERMRFWEVLANVRWAVIALQQSDRFLIQGARDLATAIIGRRATECDLELLMLLDPEKAASPPAGERAGVRGQSTMPLQAPSPGSPLPGRAILSRTAGEEPTTTIGLDPIRDLPSGAGLLALGRELLLREILPLLPSERHRAVRLVATAMAIAEREAEAGEAPAREIAALLGDLYGEAGDAARASRPTDGQDARRPEDARACGDGLMHRFAADLRAGAFDRCESRKQKARAILWRLTILKLREGNPGFLAANGFGE